MKHPCWFPVKTRGVYEPIYYSDNYYFDKKDWICETEEECQLICDDLNNKIDNAIKEIAQKCFNNITVIEKKYDVHRRFIIPRFMSELKNIELEQDEKLNYKDTWR